MDRVTPAAPSARPDALRVSIPDPNKFATDRVQRFTHTYHLHPLMQMSELAKLAKELMPTKQCRFLKPGSTQASAFDHADTSHDGRAIDDVFARIEEPGSWVALYNVETVPRYAEFVTEVIGSVRPMVERDQGKVSMINGFMFISAPPSVTPFHIDRENNFWLQIHGRKTMNVWEASDRQTVPAVDIEEFIINRALDKIRLKDGYVQRSHECDVGPGDGVYFPSTSPHMTRSEPGWTRPGDGVSVSIGVTFYTELTRKHAQVHQFNETLRRTGVVPRPPGQSGLIDSLKAPLGHLLGAYRYRKRGDKGPPGSY